MSELVDDGGVVITRELVEGGRLKRAADLQIVFDRDRPGRHRASGVASDRGRRVVGAGVGPPAGRAALKNDIGRRFAGGAYERNVGVLRPQIESRLIRPLLLGRRSGGVEPECDRPARCPRRRKRRAAPLRGGRKIVVVTKAVRRRIVVNPGQIGRGGNGGIRGHAGDESDGGLRGSWNGRCEGRRRRLQIRAGECQRVCGVPQRDRILGGVIGIRSNQRMLPSWHRCFSFDNGERIACRHCSVFCDRPVRHR